MGEAERGDSAPRLYVSYFCSNRHETRPAFAADAVVPETWDCPRCGLPANLDSENRIGPRYLLSPPTIPTACRMMSG